MAEFDEGFPLAPETGLPPIEPKEAVLAAVRELVANATLEQTGALVHTLRIIKEHVSQTADLLQKDGEEGIPVTSRTDDAQLRGQAEGLREGTDTILDYLRQLFGFPEIEYVDE
jgi:hypothetical protein